MTSIRATGKPNSGGLSRGTLEGGAHRGWIAVRQPMDLASVPAGRLRLLFGGCMAPEEPDRPADLQKALDVLDSYGGITGWVGASRILGKAGNTGFYVKAAMKFREQEGSAYLVWDCETERDRRAS
jgi:hypothetical protein